MPVDKRPSRSMAILVTALVVGLLAMSCDGGTPPSTTAPPGPSTTLAGPAALPDSGPPTDYAVPEHWLCKPGRDDVCAGDLSATVVRADGSMTPEPWPAGGPADVDCFYVYPTTSRDRSDNSDLQVGDKEEIALVRQQGARFRSQCRVFAPVYRQVTLAAVLDASPDAPVDRFTPERTAIAYHDVEAAFRYYLEHDNGGRGIVLVGHSQGSSLLLRLLRTTFAADPALRNRLVSAMLIGFIPTDQPDFDLTPPCREPDQVGCLVTYSTYRSTARPAADAIFGQTTDGRRCTNPADLVGGGPAPLRSYFPRSERVWVQGASVQTPFVTTPDLASGTCVTVGDTTYLEITVHGDPADPRTDDVPGDFLSGWGLHVYDVELALGDLVELAGRQAAAWRRAR